MAELDPKLPPFEEARARLRAAMERRHRGARDEAHRRSIGPKEEARCYADEVDVATVGSVRLADLLAVFARLDALNSSSRAMFSAFGGQPPDWLRPEYDALAAIFEVAS